MSRIGENFNKGAGFSPEQAADDWRQAGPTVGAILANRWLVYTECDLCELRFVTRAPDRVALARAAGFRASEPLRASPPGMTIAVGVTRTKRTNHERSD